MDKTSISLSSNWQLKERDTGLSLSADFESQEGWCSAVVPGTVQQALLATGRIPDPFDGMHEKDVQWIGERDWLYRCTFELSEECDAAAYVALHFEGLDTFATVWLNGVEIVRSDNMFVPQRAQVKSLLHPDENTLHIVFESALRRGRELEEANGKRIIWGDGDASRVYVRKAQYHYGWDWGPTLITAGPWRAVRLEAYDGRIADLLCNADVEADLASAHLPVIVDIDLAERSQDVQDVTCQVSVYDPQGKQIEDTILAVLEQTGGQSSGRYQLRYQCNVAQPQLWWPRGHGEQPLYRLVVTLRRGTEQLDQRELRLGLRRLQLIQQPFVDQPGSSFYFEINNKSIFCGGANWIPADSFTPCISTERYSNWLQLAADANMTMLRVWGGGIYEEDIFYDRCDQLGILVWQDFMFACGMYPALDWFLASVRAEAEANVRRLHHHPSIVLWCGNNEDYMHTYPLGFYDEKFEGDFTQIPFAGREIYEHLLPQVCGQLDPERPYWRGSPYGGANANDATQGDQHCWDVWHGPMANYHRYAELGGRFVSEFGMQACPVRPTIDAFTTPEERYPLSRTLEHHNKASDGSRRLAVYLSDTGCLPVDLDSYIYATQFLQSEALSSGIRGWRRQWKGAGKEYVSGALVWQINDCWPVTSWAFVDYHLRPKPAYYSIRRELASVVVGMATNASQQAEIWAGNDTQQTFPVELLVRRWTLDGELLEEQRKSYTLAPNQTTELEVVPFVSLDCQVLSAQLLQDNQIIARTTLWPEPFKYLSLPDPAIQIERIGEETLSVQAKRPAKGVWLTIDGEEGAIWSDNMLDLLPGDVRTITVKGVGERAVHVDRLRS